MHRRRLRRRHDSVLRALQQQQRLGEAAEVLDGRALGVGRGRGGERADQLVGVARLELVGVRGERGERADAVERAARREDLVAGVGGWAVEVGAWVGVGMGAWVGG